MHCWVLYSPLAVLKKLKMFGDFQALHTYASLICLAHVHLLVKKRSLEQSRIWGLFPKCGDQWNHLLLGLRICMMPRGAPCASVSMCIARGWCARSRCKKLCTAGLVGAQRTIQNNDNSEPGLWRLSNACFLLLLSWLLQWTGLLCFFPELPHCTNKVVMSAKYRLLQLHDYP